MRAAVDRQACTLGCSLIPQMILSRNLRRVNRSRSCPATRKCLILHLHIITFLPGKCFFKGHFLPVPPAGSAFCCFPWIQERRRSMGRTPSLEGGGGIFVLMRPFNTPKEHVVPAERAPSGRSRWSRSCCFQSGPVAFMFSTRRQALGIRPWADLFCLIAH